MAQLLSKNHDFKGVFICPTCHSITAYKLSDLENRKEKIRNIRGGRVRAGYSGQVECANPKCSKKIQVECK